MFICFSKFEFSSFLIAPKLVFFWFMMLKSSQGNLSEEEGRKLFQQLIDAISYCHDKGVYHRDLKVIKQTYFMTKM